MSGQEKKVNKKKENPITRKLKSFIKMDDYGELLREDVFGFIRNYDKIDSALDVGCAFGTSARFLKAMGCKKVYGLDIRQDCVEVAKKYTDECINCNIENTDLPYEKKSFDYICFSDVLEHLYDPLAILKKYMEYLKDDGFITVSLPNIRHYTLIFRLIIGRWEYTPIGLLDKTHIRFFTFREMVKLFKAAGLEVENARGGLFIGAMKQVMKMLFVGFPDSDNIAKRKKKLKKYENESLRYKKACKPLFFIKLWLFRLFGVHAYQYQFVLRKANSR